MDAAAFIRKRVCVVSNSAGVRALLAALIEAEGYTVADTETEETGLDRAARFRPDALVVEAPTGQANALVTRLRARPELAGCGLLVISARLEVPAHSEGAWATFSKPFDLLKLHAAVAACAHRY